MNVFEVFKHTVQFVTKSPLFAIPTAYLKRVFVSSLPKRRQWRTM